MAQTAPFERYPQQYDSWFEKNRYVYQSELRAVGKAIPPQGRGIEIGVGSGRFGAPLGVSMGVEPSPRMCSLAVRKGIKVVMGVGEQLPVANGMFDFALLVTTICFLDDVKQALREAHRVIKDHGHIIVGFVDKNSILGRDYQSRRNKSRFYSQARFYSVDKVLFHMQQAGFARFGIYQTLFKPLPEIHEAEPARKGYGDGAFVVIKGEKVTDDKALKKPKK